MKKYLFISIKEQYVTRIFDGTKEIELRKSKPNVNTGDHVIIYCTSPVKAIVGVAKVQAIIVHTPQKMWKLHSRKLGIDRADYFKYYDHMDKAIGIVLSDAKRLNYKICLSHIKEQLPKFNPPQTYQYFMNFIPPDNEMEFRLILQ